MICEGVRRCGKIDCSNDLVASQVGIDLRSLAGQTVKLGKRNAAWSFWSFHLYDRVECGKCNAHV